MALAASLSGLGRLIVDYALPPRCPACGVIVEDDNRFCQSCWSGIHFLADPSCARCGIPFAVDPGPHAVCASCETRPPPWQSARAALAYGEAARIVALRLKYGRRTGAARLMAQLMTPRVPDAVRAAGHDALIMPVPLHRWRLWGRGFNQSLLLARPIGKALSIPVDPFTLRRIHATRPLRNLGSDQRERAVRGAFALDPARAEIIRGKTILLIDDIHTSGATARACTEILLKGGASAVHLLSWAHVMPGNED